MAHEHEQIIHLPCPKECSLVVVLGCQDDWRTPIGQRSQPHHHRSSWCFCFGNRPPPQPGPVVVLLVSSRAPQVTICFPRPLTAGVWRLSSAGIISIRWTSTDVLQVHVWPLTWPRNQDLMLQKQVQLHSPKTPERPPKDPQVHLKVGSWGRHWSTSGLLPSPKQDPTGGSPGRGRRRGPMSRPMSSTTCEFRLEKAPSVEHAHPTGQCSMLGPGQRRWLWGFCYLLSFFEVRFKWAFRGGLWGSSQARMVSPLSSRFVHSSRRTSFVRLPLWRRLKQFLLPKELATKDVKSRLVNPEMHNWVFACGLSEPLGSSP